MPPIINCVRFPYCQNYVYKMGELCDACKRQQAAFENDWRHKGWTRYEENESARNGHKGKKDK